MLSSFHKFIYSLKGAKMLPVTGHPDSIAQVLGQMVKKWIDVLPEGVRALEKFNRENKDVLLKTGAEKARILTEIRLKAFKGTASGQRLDLSVFVQPYEPLNEEALHQKEALAAKGGL